MISSFQLRPHLLIVAFLSHLSLHSGATVYAAEADSELSLLVFGDSLSAAYGIEERQGWVELMRQRVENQGLPVQLHNASVSGETSSGGLARLPAALASHEPDIVLLELGGNDGLRGLPLKLLKQNLQRMIDLIRDSDAQVILAGMQIPPNYGPRYTLPFTELFGELAAENSIPFIPFLIDGIPQQPELMQSDGIHPRAEAQTMIVDNVWEIVSAEIDHRLQKAN